MSDKKDNYSRQVTVLANRAAKDALGEILKQDLPPLPHIFSKYFEITSKKFNFSFPSSPELGDESQSAEPSQAKSKREHEEMKIMKKALDEISSLSIEFAALNAPNDSDVPDKLSEALDEINLAMVPEDYVEVLEKIRLVYKNHSSNKPARRKSDTAALSNLREELSRTKDTVILQDLQVKKLKEMLNTSLSILELDQEEFFLEDLENFDNLEQLNKILKTRLLKNTSSYDLFLSNIYSILQRVLSPHQKIWVKVQTAAKKSKTLEERVQNMVEASSDALKHHFKLSSELKIVIQTMLDVLEKRKSDGHDLTDGLIEFKRELVETDNPNELANIRKKLISKMEKMIDKSEQMKHEVANIEKDLGDLRERLSRSTDQIEKDRSSQKQDDLTGLKLRNHFHTYFKKAFKEWKESGNGALLIIDIDHLSNYNDIFGFDKGDKVISHYAKELIDILSRDAKIFRHGGEEYSILIDNGSEKYLKSLCKKIVSLSQATGAKKLKSPPLSIGAASFMEGDNPKNILRRCLAGLRMTKRNGGNGFMINLDNL